MATDFAHFFDLSLDLLATIDADGIIRDTNPAWKRSVGFGRDELVDRNVSEFIHPDDRAGLAESMGRVTHGAPMLHFETRFRCKDGAFKWLAWTMNYHAGDQLAYCVARDVTSYREAMAERDRTIEESHRVQGELERRQEQHAEVLSAMASPIIQVWDDVVTLPLVGIIDSVRASEMKEALLQQVAHTGARIAIVDMTGVDT